MRQSESVFDAIASAVQEGFEFEFFRAFPGGPVVMRSKNGDLRNDKIIAMGGSLGRSRNLLHDDKLFALQVDTAVVEIEAHKKSRETNNGS